MRGVNSDADTGCRIEVRILAWTQLKFCTHVHDYLSETISDFILAIYINAKVVF